MKYWVFMRIFFFIALGITASAKIVKLFPTHFLSMFPFIRSSRPVMFYKKRCPRKFRKIRRKKHVPESYFWQSCRPLTQVFSCEFCKIFIDTFFKEHLRWMLLIYFKTLLLYYICCRLLRDQKALEQMGTLKRSGR